MIRIEERYRNALRMIMSGRKTLTAEIAMEDFAIPYAAPMQQSVIDMEQPMAPKKDCGS